MCDDCLANHNKQQRSIQSLMIQLNEVTHLLENMFENFKGVSNNTITQNPSGSIVHSNITSAASTTNNSGNSNTSTIISGTDVNSGLEMVKLKKYLHVSNFKPSTTSEDIKTHILVANWIFLLIVLIAAP